MANLDALKAALQKQEEWCRDGARKVPVITEGGPVNLPLARAIIAVIEEQQREIDELKRGRGRR